MDGQCEITINGTTVGLKFNRYAIEQGLLVKGSASLYKELISQVWGGILGYAFAKQLEPAVSFEQVCDWIEEQDLTGDPDKQIEKITEAFQTSLFYKTTVKKKAEPEDVEPEDEEKKSNGLTISDSSLPAS